MLSARLSFLTRVPCRSLVNNVIQNVSAQSGSRLQLRAPQINVCRLQQLTTGTRTSGLRKLKRATIKERLMAPTGGSAFVVGKAGLAGVSLVGLGALCYYGLGLSNEVGAIDRASMWPEVVCSRVRDTYMYFGGSLIFTAASAVAIARTPVIMNLMMKSSWMAMLATMAAMMGSGYICRMIPYSEGLGKKQLAWMVHSAVVGAVIAPLTILGGPIMLRAACYTAGIVGGLSTLAMCAPSDKFLNMGGPLAMGLGVVFMSSIGSAFLPASTVLGAGLYSISMYGGLALFGMFLLYDTQKIIRKAETHPVYATQPFDPINASIGIYLDTINIFMRIAMLLAGGGGKRK